MSIFILLAAATSSPNPLIANWGNCMMAYSSPRLQTETVEQLINGSFAACPAQESATRQSYIRQFGPQKGAEGFAGLKQGMRKIMQQRLTTVKQRLGN